LELLRAIIEGKHLKVQRIAGLLRRHQDAALAMPVALVDTLDARFGAGRVAQTSVTPNSSDLAHAA
jgi:hypothetical protein